MFCKLTSIFLLFDAERRFNAVVVEMLGCFKELVR